eukprot:augustus_masked-scaffold_1-processed-gene-11.2-mRNA-1 protein AED:1.00 eAED:1.00 QI:0/-1/0/0/-1/1/1/0/388
MSENLLDFLNIVASSGAKEVEEALKSKNPEYTVAQINAVASSTSGHCLLYAAANNTSETLLVLLDDERVDISLTTSNKSGPFHMAANSTATASMKVLCTHERTKGLINQKDKFGDTALHICAANGSKKAAECALILLDAGADITLSDNSSRGPLDVAKQNGEGFLVKTLEDWIEKASDEVKGKVSALSKKAESEQKKVIDDLVGRTSPMANVFMKSNAGALRSKLKKTETVEKHIFNASGNKVLDKVQSTAQTIGKKALSKVIEHDVTVEELRVLLEKNEVDIVGKDYFNLNALHKFSSWQRSDLIELVIQEYKNQNKLNEKGGEVEFTPLHYCVDNAKPSLSVVELLINAGADPQAVSKAGTTVLSLFEKKFKGSEEQKQNFISLLK